MLLSLELIKTIFLPLTQQYLMENISLKDYVLTCMDTRSHYIHNFNPETEAQYIQIIDDLYFDMDDVWLDYDPDDQSMVEHCKTHPGFIILEPEFNKRCKSHFNKMRALFSN